MFFNNSEADMPATYLVFMAICGTWPLCRMMIFLRILKEVAKTPSEISACRRGASREKFMTVMFLIIYAILGVWQIKIEHTWPFGLIMLFVTVALSGAILIWYDQQLKKLAVKFAEAE